MEQNEGHPEYNTFRNGVVGNYVALSSEGATLKIILSGTASLHIMKRGSVEMIYGGRDLLA